MAGLIQIYKGTDATFDGQLLNGGNPVTSFTSGDTISATLWAGDDTATLSTISAAWVDATQATYQLFVVPANTSSLAAGRYQLRVTITTAAGKIIPGDQQDVDVIDSVGSATAPTTYCSYADMLTYMDSLPLLKSNLSQAGFAEARGLARSHFESVIQAHAPKTYWTTLGSPVYLGVYSGIQARSIYLQQQLDADKLIVTPLVKQINALIALAIVCEGQVSTNQKEQTNYQMLGARFRKRASNLMKSYIAEVDLNADGYAEIQIHCGIMDGRV